MFLNLFKPTQRDYLKEVSQYNDFVNTIIPTKDRLPISGLNTEDELDIVKALITNNETVLNQVNE